MFGLCKYKDIFGIPGKGIHSIQIFGIAVVDVALTIIAVIILAWLFNWPIIYTLICLFILGIIAHRIFCVRTTVDKLIFPNMK